MSVKSLSRYFIVALTVALVVGQRLPAQDDTTKEENLKKRLRAPEFSSVTDTFIAGNFATPETKKVLTDLYQIHLERFQLSVNHHQLTEFRKEFSKNLSNAAAAPSSDVHKEITAILQRDMQKLAGDQKQHVAVRHNALLVLGELDTVVSAGKTVPLAAMLPLLLQNYDDEQAEDAVRVAALVGIQRHAAAGIADKNQVGEIQNRMLALAKNNQFLKKGSPEAQIFVRQRALSVLRTVRQPGVGNGDEVLLAAVAILQDKGSPTHLKASAAQTIGWLNLSTNLAATHGETIGKAVGQLVVEATARQKGDPKQKTEYDQTCFVLYSAETALRGPNAERPPAPNQLDGAPGSLVRLSEKEKKQYLQDLAAELDEVIKRIEKAKPQAPKPDLDPAQREKQASDNQVKFEAEVASAVKRFRDWLATSAVATANAQPKAP